MNEEFSGRGRGRELGRIGGWGTGRGLGYWEGVGTLGGVWEMGEERTGDGSSKRVEGGRNRGKLPSTALQSKNG